MNSEDLLRFLKDDEPLTFTYAEIEQMMDDEMAKDPEDMDTEFVNLCAEVLLNALSKETEKANKGKRIKIRLVKTIAVAAILIVILGFSIPVSAKYIYNDSSDKIVKFYEDHFSINLRNANVNDETHFDNSADLIAELKDNGFDNVVLPDMLFKSNYKYTLDITENDEFLTTVLIDFINQNDNSIAGIAITRNKNGVNKLSNSEMQMTIEYDSAKQLSVNGRDIFVFGNNNDSSIIYIDNDTYYDIELINTEFDLAVKIAESIK